MPPGKPIARYGKWSNDPSLTQEELTLTAWVDGGKAEGDPKDCRPRLSSRGWKIGKPDQVFAIPEQKLEARARTYTYLTVPTNFTEDKWVRAAELRAGNRKWYIMRMYSSST